MNQAREAILARVREALRTQAHPPPAPTTAPIWPAIPDLRECFRREFIALRGEIIDTPDQLKEFLTPFSKICTDGSPLVSQVVGPATYGVRDADLGVTGCDCVIAQTGTLAVSTLSAGGRAMSVLPPNHLVIARWNQLVADLPAAIEVWKGRYANNWPSNLSLISGPSRTGDIEKILVMGAHGPKRLAIYFAG